MKTLKLLGALTTVALVAGCQHSQRSASMSRDQSDNEVTLTATSNDTNITVYSDGRTARLNRNTDGDRSERTVASPRPSDRTAGEGYRADATVQQDDRTASGVVAGQTDSSAGTAEGKAADNTGRNVRDRNDQTLTPEDQGTSEADVDMTRRIRKVIMQKDGLSMNAKNIKIITVNGKVTLRGPVNSQEEKDSLSLLAQAVAGGEIDNQLEVKATNQ